MERLVKSSGKGPMDKYFIGTSEKVKHIYDWIEWIVDDNLQRKQRELKLS